MPNLVTQCSVPQQVIQGAYAWLCDSQEFNVCNSGGGWPHQEPTPQYDLFTVLVDEKPVFPCLVAQWRIERGIRSSTTDILLCPAYQAIIGMGPEAVPMILAQMASEGDDPDQWFWALQALTHANPVAEEDEGNFAAMAKAWIEWSRKRYIW